jgi:putative toxin-antitoxin system antitoxin component (TIGR02293 family)
LSRAHAIEMGLPVKMLRVLLKDGEIGINDLARIIAPRRTLERRLKEGERLTMEESDRLARFLTILELCEYLFGDRHEAMDWLRSPMLSFNERAPIDLLRTSAGSEAVNNLLQRGRHGMLA